MRKQHNTQIEFIYTFSIGKNRFDQEIKQFDFESKILKSPESLKKFAQRKFALSKPNRLIKISAAVVYYDGTSDEFEKFKKTLPEWFLKEGGNKIFLG